MKKAIQELQKECILENKSMLIKISFLSHCFERFSVDFNQSKAYVLILPVCCPAKLFPLFSVIVVCCCCFSFEHHKLHKNRTIYFRARRCLSKPVSAETNFVIDFSQSKAYAWLMTLCHLWASIQQQLFPLCFYFMLSNYGLRLG